MDVISILAGLLIGSIIAYIIFYLLNKTKSVSISQYNELTNKHNEAVSNIKAFEEKVNNFQIANTDLTYKLSKKEVEYSLMLIKQSSTETKLKFSETKIEELAESLKLETETNRNQQTEINQGMQKISELNANNNYGLDSLNKQNIINDRQTKQIEQLDIRGVVGTVLGIGVFNSSFVFVFVFVFIVKQLTF